MRLLGIKDETTQELIVATVDGGGIGHRQDGIPATHKSVVTVGKKGADRLIKVTEIDTGPTINSQLTRLTERVVIGKLDACVGHHPGSTRVTIFLAIDVTDSQRIRITTSHD